MDRVGGYHNEWLELTYYIETLDSNTSIGDGSSWISRIRGGAATLWVAPRPHRLCALKTEEQKCLNYEERRAAEQNWVELRAERASLIAVAC